MSSACRGADGLERSAPERVFARYRDMGDPNHPLPDTPEPPPVPPTEVPEPPLKDPPASPKPPPPMTALRARRAVALIH